MARRFVIRPARGVEDLRVVADLMMAYAAALPIDLSYQGFDAEVAGLPGPYAGPGGELLLARDENAAPVGCIALRPLPFARCCEIKRLYAKPEARGLGLGKALAEHAIAVARVLGYGAARLDTLPSMKPALRLYAAIGFAPTAPYYSPTPPGTIFLGLTL